MGFIKIEFVSIRSDTDDEIFFIHPTCYASIQQIPDSSKHFLLIESKDILHKVPNPRRLHLIISHNILNSPDPNTACRTANERKL